MMDSPHCPESAPESVQSITVIRTGVMAMKDGRTMMRQTAAPENYEELRGVLQHNLPKYAPGQSRIARLLLTDLSGFAVRSLDENAQAAQVHSSSVVRFAKSLGFDGYPSLAKLCREQLSEQAHLLQRFDQALRQEHAEATADESVPQAAQYFRNDIALTFSQIDQNAWQKAIEAIAHAANVHICGLQKCFSAAYLFSYLLHMARNRVYLLDNPAGDMLSQLREIDSQDVFIAISIHEYTSFTVAAARRAKERGATVIAITDAPSSPLAAVADHAFFAECEGPYVFRSLSAIFALVESMAGEVSIALGENTRSQLLQDSRLIKDLDLYTQD